MSYDIGYGKPPKEHQFKKGKSGNNKGRPMKSRGQNGQSADMMKSLAKALNRKIEINERGVIKKISIFDAIINKQIQAALVNGDQKALAQIFSLAEKVYRAALEGRIDDTLRIIVTGGLPDDQAMPAFDIDAQDGIGFRPTSTTST